MQQTIARIADLPQHVAPVRRQRLYMA